MERNLIKGNTALARELGVCRDTVQKWRAEGLLEYATVVDIRRTVIYDMDRVYQCLQNRHLLYTQSVKSKRKSS